MIRCKYITITIISLISSLITLQANASMGEENIIPKFTENRGEKRKTLCGKFPINPTKMTTFLASQNVFCISQDQNKEEPKTNGKKRRSEKALSIRESAPKTENNPVSVLRKVEEILEKAEDILSKPTKDPKDALLFLVRAYKAIVMPKNSIKETLDSFKSPVASSEVSHEKEQTIHDVLDKYVNLLENENHEKKNFTRIARIKASYYKFYSERALKGDVVAKRELRIFYDKNKEEFNDYMGKHSLGVRAKNLFSLGLEYLHGKKNESENDKKLNQCFGIDLLKRIREVKEQSAKKGVIDRKIENFFSLSSRHLAKTFYLGTAGVPRNYEEAAVYLRIASDYGSPVAKSLLAAMYYDGSGVEKSRVKALEFLQALKAIYGEERPGVYPEDYRLLGRIYQKRLEESEKNSLLYEQNCEEALLNYEEAVDRGDDLAKYYLCKMLNKCSAMIGIIAKKTKEMNLEDQSLPEEALMGKVLENVMLRCRDLFNSFFRMLISRQQISDTPQYGRLVHKLGRMYENGWGCKKNTVLAEQCYDRAISNGYYKKSKSTQTNEPHDEPDYESSEVLEDLIDEFQRRI